jgi:alkylhydroperoxidase family enzyme
MLRAAMARLPYPDPDELSDRTREALDALPPLNVFRMLSHAESAFRPYLRFGGALLSQLELDALQRELAILQVARVHEAEYEWIQHVSIARAVGMTDAQLAALEAGDLDAEAFDPAQRVVLRFTDELQRAPRPDDATFAALREHLPPRQIVELILVTGAYAMLGRLMTATDLDLDGPLGDAVIDSARRG